MRYLSCFWLTNGLLVTVKITVVCGIKGYLLSTSHWIVLLMKVSWVKHQLCETRHELDCRSDFLSELLGYTMYWIQEYTQKLKYSVQYYLIWIINYWFLWHFGSGGCFKIFSECISYISFHPMLWRILYLFVQPIGLFATDGHVMHFSRTHWFRHW